MEEVVVPAERWKKLASAYSAHLAVEQRGDKPISVLAVEHGGCLYTAFSIIHGAYGGKTHPCVKAYRLVPLNLYSGETTTLYHDTAAVHAGLRKRGDHTGLIVLVRRQRMVCAEEVRFVIGLPETKPIPLQEAQAYDERWRRCGWRRFRYGSVAPEWASLKGHPVAVYRFGDTGSVLLWKHDGEVHELWVDQSVPLDAPPKTAHLDTQGQLSLF